MFVRFQTKKTRRFLKDSSDLFLAGLKGVKNVDLRRLDTEQRLDRWASATISIDAPREAVRLPQSLDCCADLSRSGSEFIARVLVIPKMQNDLRRNMSSFGQRAECNAQILDCCNSCTRCCCTCSSSAAALRHRISRVHYSFPGAAFQLEAFSSSFSACSDDFGDIPAFGWTDSTLGHAGLGAANRLREAGGSHPRPCRFGTDALATQRAQQL